MSLRADLDLLGRRKRATPLSWVSLAVAVLAAMTMVHHREDLLERLSATHDRLDSVQRFQNRAQAALPGHAASTAAERRRDLKSLEAANSIAAGLTHPWPEVFEGVERATSGVAMLALRHDSDSPFLEIEAAVADEESAWRLVHDIASGTQRFRSSTLVSEQPLSPSVNGMTLRVLVRAQLDTPIPADRAFE